MQKLDYIYMIIDNVMVFGVELPIEFQGNKLKEHLNKFNENHLKIVAGFNQDFLEHFLKISQGKTQNNLENILKKMETISHIISPTGNLNYIGSSQIEYILTKIDSLKINEITEKKISLIADEQLEKEFGGHYSENQAFENQLASAAFYLMNMGYPQQEIQEKIVEVKQDPLKLDALFNLPKKEIYSLPSELQSRGNVPHSTRSQEISIDQSQEIQDAINHHIQAIHHNISKERAQKVNEIMHSILEHIKDKMTEQYDKVFRQIHPDRLNKAYKMLKQTKRKSKRMDLLLEWFFCSHLLSAIELKVEHWQVSSQATHGQSGVYTAGIDFSRYDNIIRDFQEKKLAKVINIARRILRTPSKRAIQKLGQDLVAETGFDEHLYFTD
ncbi:MAG: hypothetical protein ACFFAN_14290 [Promethearchaeota archaeon]